VAEPSGSSGSCDGGWRSRTVRKTPGNLLELLVWVIDDPARTRRVGLLVGTLLAVTAGCVAGVLYVIQLRPEMWAYVVAASASVIAVAERVRRLRIAGRLEVQAAVDEESGPPPDRAASATPGRRRR
jgi:hypothetical protein